MLCHWSQIFNVRLNGELNVVNDLDIFSEVGFAVAHDVYVPFTVEEDELEANGVRTDFTGILNVEFVKVSGFFCEIFCCRDPSNLPECGYLMYNTLQLLLFHEMLQYVMLPVSLLIHTLHHIGSFAKVTHSSGPLFLSGFTLGADRDT